MRLRLYHFGSLFRLLDLGYSSVGVSLTHKIQVQVVPVSVLPTKLRLLQSWSLLFDQLSRIPGLCLIDKSWSCHTRRQYLDKQFRWSIIKSTSIDCQQRQTISWFIWQHLLVLCHNNCLTHYCQLLHAFQIFSHSPALCLKCSAASTSKVK